ncbi:hypothetical protein COV24_02405 [candidate division WWE3 bacterium CG10_big_fil_rev_8_21_14_0_10_32_10]|uniref:Uncharacterized protein n=1 Tax=candidate division WWE3 bacterium CG10_big_fil_rev_8_21_14_0_10_32_10 TaxID=1975090 RepID=A0A2H0RBS2_UNCKA|nr:MAG: hypothetical protein COV24_02405 [candidate division WWE3 bacterium CG10_big_fil_rev_8_21_14_0_10_32_10]
MKCLLNQDIQKPKPKKSLFKIFFITFLLFFILTGGLSSAAMLVAYKKIDIGNPELQKKIEYTVLSIPFLPKTPEYVLGKSVKAHKNITTAYINASFAAESPYIGGLGIVSGNKLDFLVEGPIDYSNPKNPKSSLTIKLGNDFDSNTMFLDNVFYFKLNKVPSVVSVFTGIKPSVMQSKIYNKWVSYDLSPLETNARDMLDKETTQKEDDLSKAYSEVIDKVLSENLVPSLKMSEDFLDSQKEYKINLNLNKEQIDTLQKNVLADLSNKGYPQNNYTTQPFDKMDLTIWINKTTYYLKRVSINTEINLDNQYTPTGVLGFSTTKYLENIPESKNSTIKLAFVIDLSKVGESQNIVKPEDSQEFDSFLETIMNESSLFLGNTTNLNTSSKIVENIALAGNLYYGENSKYPEKVEDLYEYMAPLSMNEGVNIKNTNAYSMVTYTTKKDMYQENNKYYYTILSTKGVKDSGKYYTEQELKALVGTADFDNTLKISEQKQPNLLDQ